MTTVAHALPVLDTHAVQRAWWAARATAVLLDGAVLGALAWAALGTEAAAPRLWPGLGPVATPDAPPWTSSAVLVGAVAALAALQAWTGATPGKRVVGVVVVDAVTGRPVGLVRTLLRQVAHVLDSFLLIGYVRAGLDAEGRTFADQLVGTRVLAARRPPGWGPAVGPPGAGPGLTAGAVVLVVLGLAGTLLTASGGGSARTLQQVCPVVAGTGVHAEVVRDVDWSRERRFGVWVRERIEPSAVRVQWFAEATPSARPTELAAGVTDLDDGRRWTTVAPPDTEGGSGTWSLALPADDLAGAERLELEAHLRSSDGTVATCRTVVDLRGTDDAPAVP